MDLDDILSDKEPEKEPEPAKEPAEQAAKEPAKEPDAKEPEKEPAGDPVEEQLKSRRKEHRKKELTAQGRDPETGQFVAKELGAKEPAEAPKEPAKEPVKEPASALAVPAQPEFTEREKAFLRAAQEERTKRQELERRMAAPPPAKDEPAKTFWEDPEGALARQNEQHQAQLRTVWLNTAEAIARTRYTDYEQEKAVFVEMATQSPALYQEMLVSPDPAEFAYRTGKARRELKEAGGLEQLKAKIEAETRTRLEAEYRAKEEARLKELAAQRAALPGSLSDVRGASAPRKLEYTGPTPLADILKP